MHSRLRVPDPSLARISALSFHGTGLVAERFLGIVCARIAAALTPDGAETEG